METNPKILQKQYGHKPQNTEYKLKQYKLKVLKVSLIQSDEKLWCTWNIYICNLRHLHKTH